MIFIDAGNTNIDIACFENGKFRRLKRIPTAKVTKASLTRSLTSGRGQKIIVCSVVPRVTKLIRNLKMPVSVVGKEIKVPMKSSYDRQQIGMDRLVGALAAKKLFPEVRLVLDFGTAITLDFLSSSGAYQGGIILPGIGSTLAVFSKCALLPKMVRLKKSRKLIPADTEASITRGIVEGFSAMVNSLVEKYKKKLKIPQNQEVIITGGEASLIMPSLNFPFKYEPILVLKGLEILSRTFC